MMSKSMENLTLMHILSNTNLCRKMAEPSAARDRFPKEMHAHMEQGSMRVSHLSGSRREGTRDGQLLLLRQGPGLAQVKPHGWLGLGLPVDAYGGFDKALIQN
jgi:hypothetical protein